MGHLLGNVLLECRAVESSQVYRPAIVAEGLGAKPQSHRPINCRGCLTGALGCSFVTLYPTLRLHAGSKTDENHSEGPFWCVVRPSMCIRGQGSQEATGPYAQVLLNQTPNLESKFVLNSTIFFCLVYIERHIDLWTSFMQSSYANLSGQRCS